MMLFKQNVQSKASQRMHINGLMLCMVLFGSSPVAAQQIPMEIQKELRDEGQYARRSHPSVDYDFAAYKKSERIDTPFGQYRSWDYPYNPNTGRFQAEPSYRLDQPYFTRTGGVKRGRFFSPDEIGKLYRDHYLLWSDGLGNTLYESLKISSKYGLNHYFYAPDYDPVREEPAGPELPITDAGIAEYARAFPAELDYMLEFVNEVDPLYYKNFVGNPEQLWMLFTGIDTSPLDLFLTAAERDYPAIEQEFRSRYGFDLPLRYDANDPQDVVKRIKMWEYMREQHGKLTYLRSRLFRDHVAGPGRIGSNIHMATQVDYEWYGESFDYPGVAIRPMLQDDELAWRYYMGYGTRLTNDLTDKVPLVSPRINLASTGARVVPTPSTTKYWFSQVVQNGAVGFYDWLNDYPARENDPTAYGGFVYGNPDPSARGKERWNTALELSKTLAQAYVFTPPPSEFGILVNIEDANVKNGWFNIFSAYIELTQAEVWNTFISSTELRNGSESLDRYKVLVVPKIEYVYRSVADQIESFVQNGGTVVVTDPHAFSHEMNGSVLTNFRQSLLGVSRVEEYSGSDNTITFTGAHTGASISPYNTPHRLVGDLPVGVDVIARYPDGSAAVISHPVGKGRVIFAPGSLFDIYTWKDYSAAQVDTGRSLFYKQLEQAHGIKDNSWVWDVTVDNVHELTGTYKYNLPPVQQDIVFRWYMNPFLP